MATQVTTDEALKQQGMTAAEVRAAKAKYDAGGMSALSDREKFVLARGAPIIATTTGYDPMGGNKAALDDFARVGQEVGAAIETDNKGAAAFATSQKESAAGTAADKQIAGNSSAIAAANKQGQTFAPKGNDLSNAGVYEQYWDVNQGKFSQPTQTQQNYDQNKWEYGMPGAGEAVGGAVAKDQQAVSKTGGDMSAFYNKSMNQYGMAGGDVIGKMTSSVDPAANLDNYYDYAFKKASGSMNAELAARGMFGSSAGMQMVGNVGASLQADQAQHNAQYGLDRAQYELQRAGAIDSSHQAWNQEQGNLAAGASKEKLDYGNSSVANAHSAQSDAMNRLSTGASAASSADNSNLSYLNAGFEQAGAAQDRRENRVGTAFNNKLAAGNAIAGGYMPAIGADTSAGQGQVGAGLGAAADQFNTGQAASDAGYQQYLDTMRSAGQAGLSYAQWKQSQPEGKAGSSTATPKK